MNELDKKVFDLLEENYKLKVENLDLKQQIKMLNFKLENMEAKQCANNYQKHIKNI